MKKDSAFTLVELVLATTIIGLVFGLVITRTSSYKFWQHDAATRKLVETIRFLHHQAINDQVYYRLEFDLNSEDHNNFDIYRVGRLIEDKLASGPGGGTSSGSSAALIALSSANAGALTLELESMLHPSFGSSFYMVPPQDHPELYRWTTLPEDFNIVWIRTMRGDRTRGEGGRSYIDFSPRGFSEFAVLHLELGNGAPRTIVINPYTGLTEIYKEHREFEWTYDKRQR